MVVDVRDFVNGSVEARVVGSELVVKGSGVKDAKGQPKTFTKTFPLPSVTDLASITSCMSEDGFLLVSVPAEVRAVLCRYDR